MQHEDRRAQQQRASEQKQRAKEQRQQRRAELAALADAQLRRRCQSSQNEYGTGSRCNQCGVRGDHLFSRNQLNKGWRKRCRECIEAEQLGVVAPPKNKHRFDEYIRT